MLFKGFLVFGDLESLIQQLPYRLRQIDMIHQVGHHSLPCLQRSIQILAERIGEQFLPWLQLAALPDIKIYLVNTVDPEVNLCFFFLFLLPGLADIGNSTLISFTETFETLRVIFRVGCFQ